MEINNNNANLLADLHSKQLIQFGHFVLKSGQISPIYVDLRKLITYRQIRRKTIDALCEAIKNVGIEFDYIVGVPYGALLLADGVAEKLGKDAIAKRKEIKSYGKKEMFLGDFEPGKRAVIIEDVVVSGLSIKETLDELNNVGLICEHAFCVVDREQGGVQNLQHAGLKLHSLIQMNSILDFLVSLGEIDVDKRADIAGQLKNPSYENGDANDDWNIQKRFAAFEENSLNRKLADIMLAKKTNLCLAVDKFPKEHILEIAESVGASICALKLHCNAIKGWDQQFAGKLRKIADDQNFLLFEDGKFGDTPETMETQLTGGHYSIAEWADLVTVYPTPGKKAIEELKSIVDSPTNRLSAFLMVAELSIEGALPILNGVEVGEAIGTKMIGGFICQKKCSKNPQFYYWTPGVNMGASTDGKGQCWRGPEQAILADGCDIVIVGRGITKAVDMAAEARKYANAAWGALITKK